MSWVARRFGKGAIHYRTPLSRVPKDRLAGMGRAQRNLYKTARAGGSTPARAIVWVRRQCEIFDVPFVLKGRKYK